MEEPKNGTNGHVKAVEKSPPTLEKQRLADLLSGKVPPRNQMSSYLIQKMTSASIRVQQVIQERNQLSARLRDLEVETNKLEGVLDQYIQDLTHWETVDTGAAPHKSEDG